MPLEKRGMGDKPIFPDNVIERAEDFGLALLSSVDFFHAFCQFLLGNVAGDKILDEITKSVGVVKF